MKRNRNAHKTRIDYDLNIFIPEGEERWKLHVYRYKASIGHAEYLSPITLTQNEVDSVITGDDYFNEDDVWYGLRGFKIAKWDTMPDSLKAYFDALPIYEEDLRG